MVTPTPPPDPRQTDATENITNPPTGYVGNKKAILPSFGACM